MALNPTDEKLSPSGKRPSVTETSAEDEILMREIDEAVRQDDAQQFFKNYGVMLGAGVTLVLAAFGGYLLWDNYREGALEEQSETLVSALDNADAGNWAGAAETAAPLVETGDPGPRTVARFVQAAAALDKGDTSAAAEQFAAIANDAETPPALRDLARIREVSTNFDELEPQAVIEKLKDLAVPGNAFFGSAGELTAIAHLEAGENDQAGALFAAIAKDEEQPETLRSRARQMAGLLGVDAIEDVEQLLEDEGVDPEAGLRRQPGAGGQ